MKVITLKKETQAKLIQEKIKQVIRAHRLIGKPIDATAIVQRMNYASGVVLHHLHTLVDNGEVERRIQGINNTFSVK